MAYLDPLKAAQVFAVADWVKSSFSSDKSNNCVEWNATGSLVGLRDSKQPNGPVFVLDHSQWTALQDAAVNRADS